jgi:hypothetical protein
MCALQFRLGNSSAGSRFVAPVLLLERHPTRAEFESLEVLRVFLRILLMIIFGRPKRHRRQNLGYDRFFEFSRTGQFRLGFLGDFLLIFIGIKDRRSIARTDIGELPVALRGIDLLPVNVEQLRERNLHRIVNDLDRLAVFRLLRAHQFVGRIRFRSAAVTDRRLEHTRRFVERGLNAPETTAGENGGLCCRERSLSGRRIDNQWQSCRYQEKPDLHTVDLRQHPGGGVLNKLFLSCQFAT